jgi:hypothetical protein
MSIRLMSVIVVVTLLFTAPVTAGVVTLGPFPDFAGYVNETVSVTLDTSGTVHIPWDGNIKISDKITVRVTRPVPVYVPSYVRITIVGDPQIQDPLSFFDIYAQDLDPSNPGSTLSGFNASDPELIPLSSETFIGLSGTGYPAPVQAVYLSDLPMVVPDFDLSAFAQGDPGSIVYLAGPGNVPSADAIVPEPSTIALLVVAAIGLAVCVWRRRRAESLLA